jgi:hypothetical protein
VTVSGSRAGQASAWLRVGLEIAFIIFVIITAPIAAFLTPRSELQRAMPLFTGLVVAIAVWTVFDAVRVVRSQRAGARAQTSAPTRLDAIWDHADETSAALSPPAIVGTRALGGPIQGTELLTGLVRRTRAVELGEQRSDVIEALELALSACGLAHQPAVYWAPGAGVNAAVAGTPEGFGIVLGEGMLAAFDEEALLGALVNLLVRVQPGTVRGLRSWDPPGILGNDVRMTPAIAVSVYVAADAQTVLALRDTAQLFSALQATASGDPYFPGLTSDQAHLMWTWPSKFAPMIIADVTAGSAETVAQIIEGRGHTIERLETGRQRRLTAALTPRDE